METHSNIMSQLLEVSEKSFYRWKSKDHKKLINLIESNFNDVQLVEFLETGRIKTKNNSLEELGLYVYEIHQKIIANPQNNIEEFFNKLIIDFNKVYSSHPPDIYDEFLEFIHMYDFVETTLAIHPNVSIPYIKMHLMNVVHRVSEFEFYLYVKNIELLDN
ncbi:MAG: hypothetical protein COA44_02235 [Arcobacter sp.]|nr:MAG: hypothetical protein COA44_02235 [Arcobacter sp.]